MKVSTTVKVPSFDYIKDAKKAIERAIINRGFTCRTILDSYKESVKGGCFFIRVTFRTR